MTKRNKVLYVNSKEINGVIYKASKLSLPSKELEKIGITESSPYVDIYIDVVNNKIEIKKASMF